MNKLSTQPADSLSVLEAFLPVEPKHCHKAQRYNAFITAARVNGPDQYELTAEVDHQNENFFFDHDIDHIPGMLTACLLRQSVLVISHLFFGIPFSRKFIMDNIQMTYFRHAPLGEPITLLATILDQKMRGSELRGGICDAKIMSGEVVIATGQLGFRILTADLANRLARMTRA